MNVIVTNKNAEAYSWRWNGTEYNFETGKAVTIPVLAAAFLFGYGKTDEDRARILIRNGWQKNGMPNDPLGPKAAMEKLGNFVFKEAPAEEGRKKKEAIVLPPPKMARVPTGINAISPTAVDNGRTILPKDPASTLHLPGKAPRQAPASGQ